MSSHQDQTALTNELIQSGYVSIPQMQQALIECRKSGRSLLEMLTEITGRMLPPEILAKHQKQYLFNLKIIHGVEYFDAQMDVDPDKVAKIIDSLSILELCYQHRMLPIKLISQTPPVLKMAMVDPSQTDILEQLKQRLKRKGVVLQRLGITPEDYQQLSGQVYPKLDGSERLMARSNRIADQTIVDVTEVFEEMPLPLTPFSESHADDFSLSSQGDSSPVVALVDQILLKALESKASAIHIDPQENLLSVRFRQDGILQPALEPLPIDLASAILGRLKVMANLDNIRQQTSQKGRIDKTFAGRPVDFLLNTLPGTRGEKAIIKIIDRRNTVPSLNNLIDDSKTEKMLQRLLQRSSGLMIVTGTPLSGKSSTLYSLLSQKNQMGLSVVTVEDPIERTLSDVTQVEVNTDKGRTYSKILQSLLRQDVDVILVDRLEDPEIAHYLTDAATGGRFVMTSLTSPSITDAIAQLQQLGVTPSLLADTLVGIVNQCLVRRLCPTCRLSYTPNAAELAKFGLMAKPHSQQTFYKANVLNATAIEQARQKGRLCRTCNGQGYRGQIGLYEVFEVTPSLKALITQNLSADKLVTSAIQGGMQPLLSHALTLITQGETTTEEVERVLETELLFSSSVDSPDKIPQVPTAEVMGRIEAIEKVLGTLTREFEQLKASLAVSDSSPVDCPQNHSEVFSQPPLESVSPHPLVNFYEQTIACPDALYEELNDPGDWDALKQELDPSQETISINFSDDEDEISQSLGVHPFKSVPDPWSM